MRGWTPAGAPPPQGSTKICLLVILLVSLFGTKALFHPGFYTSHDGEHQILRLYHFDRAIKDGQIPPRWADYQVLNGHGYPLFNFSYHGPWFLGEPLRLAGLSLTTVVKAIFIFTFLFSGIFMFFWLKTIFGQLPALVGSILYVVAPYRFSNIFVRASLGEATAFMFLPLIFYGLERVKEKRMFKGVLIGSLGVGGLVLSHAMTVFIFIFSILTYFLFNFLFSYNYFSSDPRIAGRSREVSRAFFLFVLGFSLSAYYLLPAFWEKKFTQFAKSYPLMFASHFVTLKQLLYSRWGYGFSMPGVQNDGMAFQVGIGHWLACAFAVVVLALFSLGKVKERLKRQVFLAVGFIACFSFSIFMMLKTSEPVWHFITRFFPFDFPWRFLGLSVFASSFLAAFSISMLKKSGYSKLAWGLTFFLLTLNFYANRNHLKVNKYIYHNDSYYEKITNSTSSYDELLPVWAKEKYYDQKTNPVEVLKGEVQVDQVKKQSDKIMFKVKNQDKNTLLRITSLYFPGWKLFVNGKKYGFDFRNSGMIEFQPPIGESEILLIFTETLVRIIGEVISFSAFALLFLWSLKFQWP